MDGPADCPLFPASLQIALKLGFCVENNPKTPRVRFGLNSYSNSNKTVKSYLPGLRNRSQVVIILSLNAIQTRINRQEQEKGDKMAFSDSGSRDRRTNHTGNNDRRGRYRSDPYSSPEGWREDEEDYEEFARSMDRKKAAQSGPQRRGTSARSGSRPRAEEYDQYDSASRRGGCSGYREAGDLDSGPRAGGSDRRSSGSSGREKRPRRRKGGVLKAILASVLILLLIAAAAGGYAFYKMRNVLQLQRVNSVDLEAQLTPGIPRKVINDERMAGFRNIALFGVDSRTGDLLEGDNRSDTMMICSINDKTGEIRLVSVFRDTLLDVGDGELRKANTAYALGGPVQAINMLNKNLDLNIVDFVTVGFEGLANTIDALGGIEIEIDEEERGYLNQYVHDMHVELGTEDTPVDQAGLVTLSGIQATAYSRIRYTAGDDFRRAERQRIVLNKTLEKARAASPADLVKVADNVMGDLATSLSSTEILSMILKASDLNLVDTAGLPLEENRTFGNSYEEGDYILPLHLEDNVRFLHKFLFDEENYVLSEEAQEIDTAIRTSAGYGTEDYTW